MHSAAVQGLTDLELRQHRSLAAGCMGMRPRARHTAGFFVSKHKEVDPIYQATVPLVKAYLE
eukprot:2323133-Lingulodinium_polyedra.AAC.1